MLADQQNRVMLKRYQKQKGFSLIELVIVIVLLGILASFAIPSYQQMIQNSMIRGATDAIMAGFQVARGEAVGRNKPVQLEFRAANSSAWNVCVRPTPAGACVAADIIESRLENDGSSGQITAIPSQAGPYVFNGFGVMTNPAGAVTINVDSTDTSITSRNLRVVIGAGGSVRACDPALPTIGTNLDPRRCF